MAKALGAAATKTLEEATQAAKFRDSVLHAIGNPHSTAKPKPQEPSVEIADQVGIKLGADFESSDNRITQPEEE
jgi:hypothetical protein